AKDLDPIKKETRTVYRETILEKPAGARLPTKLKRHYEKAEVTLDDTVTKLPYHGKTVLIEKKENGYRFSYEGGAELKDKEAALLAREFHKQETAPDFTKLYLPGQPVEVGESWKPDAAAILKEYKTVDGPQADEAKVRATARLDRVHDKDGRRFG